VTVYGYAMVSAGAGLSGQVDLLKASGCGIVFVDESEGPRDGWTRLLAAVQPGDVVRVVSLSGRPGVADVRQALAEQGVTVEELDT
jgi:DNA invertase Pin-like site-specific DNA recombinase